MNNSSRKIDILLTFVINLIFFIVYTCFFELLHEANDDASISFLMEGAYGEYSEYAVYQHVWWGKLVVALNQFLPQIKWYVILIYGFIFLAFCGIVYAFLRMQGRKIGILTSGVLLIFCGYQTYVHFQFSRVAMVVGAAGLILLFFALEHASDKLERWSCIACGVVLALWASMIRFQMFAMAVALVAGAIGLHRVWRLLRAKDEGWIKKIGAYAVVFGTVGVVSIGLYVIDRAYYSDEEWAAYMEFNELRAELCDYGFPDYYENLELYQSFGISENDFTFYYSGNKDSELFTTEVMQALVDAKEERVFSPEDFFSTYPKEFMTLSVFTLFLVLAVIAILLNKKNLYFVLYEIIVIMVFEAYFYTMGRYGILRIDYSVWMAAVITLVYGMSDDLLEIKEIAWKWVAAILAGAIIISNADALKTDVGYEGAVGYSKFFYNEITPDKDHLYIILSTAPEVYFAFTFREPCEQGELSNIYTAYSWEYNVPVKNHILENYDIENIYRDAINNEKVYFVTGSQTEMLQIYIQENYNPNAYVVFEKNAFGIPIYSLKTAE